MPRRSRKKRFNLLGSFRRWSWRLQHRRDSLTSRQNTFSKYLAKFPSRFKRSTRFATRQFFRFQTAVPTKVGGSEMASKKLRWTNYLNPLNWILWPTGFLASLFLSRPYLSLGPALFSIAVILGVIVLYAQQQYQGGRASRLQLYQTLLASALQSKDYPRALVASKALIDLQPNDLRFQFERAQIEKELGNQQLSEDLMIRLASQRRYGLAALWLTEQKYNLTNIPEWKEDDHQKFRALMAIAIDGSSGSILNGAKFKLASYLSSLNANADALRYLVDVIPDNPQLALTACELAKSINDQVQLQNLLPIALNFYRSELSKNPADVDNRLKLSRALVLDNNFDEAIELLSDGQRLKPDEKFQNAIAEAMIYQCDRIARSDKSPNALIQRIQILHRALAMAPSNSLVVEALVDLLIQCHKNNFREAEVLREAALQGLDPESIHFIRGTIALMDNNPEEAKTHLELAAKTTLPLPGVLNNLAVAIAADPQGDLSQALAFSNTALDKLAHPYLFETRGQILFKLGRYEDCILDLEKGLQAQELSKAIYPSLVTAYEKMGNPSLAAEYATRLNQLNASAQASDQGTQPQPVSAPSVETPK